ncbi:MAG: hypothetical protein H6573_06065 [Lewinellaceae bacterium]|nr:hypothetical protein [Phaeodactylibacter sp.]MCB0612361.1 hypothetical protein [Phaeodactylibacter sp.]MCB9347069.1 hypothetical protein [Lewinellaceae bacterium]
MSDSNFRLKAVVQDAKLTCRRKLDKLKLQFKEEKKHLASLSVESNAVFRKFDQPKLWENAIAYDELNLIQKTIQLSEAPEDDLEKFTEILNGLLDAFRALARPTARSRSLFSSEATSLNIQMMDALLENRRIIDEKIELFRSNGLEPHDEPGFTDLAAQQKNLIEQYQEALENNDVRTQSTDLRLIKELFGRAFSAIKEDTPILKFIEVYERYNQEIEKRCPQDVT